MKDRFNIIETRVHSIDGDLLISQYTVFIHNDKYKDKIEKSFKLFKTYAEARQFITNKYGI